MANFRTNSIFHYTQHLQSLMSILEKGLIPNYCLEKFHYYDGKREKEIMLSFPMVSFCDIPIRQTTIQTLRYGTYAIGLSKQITEKFKISPILYSNNEDIISSLACLRSFEGLLKNELKNYSTDLKSVEIKIPMNQKGNIDLPQIKSLINYNQIKRTNDCLMAYVKQFWGEHDGEEQINYEENEWRYVVPQDDNIPWFRSMEEYKGWRGTEEKPAPSQYLVNKKIIFEDSDINHILVPSDEEAEFISNQIRKLPAIGGSEKIMTDFNKDSLIRKINTFERIEQDF